MEQTLIPRSGKDNDISRRYQIKEKSRGIRVIAIASGTTEQFSSATIYVPLTSIFLLSTYSLLYFSTYVA